SASWNLLVSLSMRMRARSYARSAVPARSSLPHDMGLWPGISTVGGGREDDRARFHGDRVCAFFGPDPCRFPSGVEPDEGGHAPARRFAAMREEALGVGVGAGSAAVYRGDPRTREALARERIEIRLPAAARVRHEGTRGLEARGGESRADLVADLERTGPDRGPEPRENLRRGRAERRDGVLHDPRGEPAPARVRDADPGPAAVRQQHG